MTAGRHSFATLASRTATSAGLLVSFAALAWADATGFLGGLPAWWLLPILMLLAIGGVDELVALYRARGLRLPGGLLRAGVVAIFVSVAVGTQAMVADTGVTAPVASLSWAALAATAAVAMLFGREIAGGRADDQALERLSAGVLVLTYLGLPMAFMVGLRLVHVENLGPEQTGAGHLGIVPLLSLIAVVKLGDVAAYLVGASIGRIPLAPRLSPGKTWEGAFGSLAGSLAAAWLVLVASQGTAFAVAAQPLGGWVGFGLLVGLAGMAGDLAESLIKRELGTKDSGRLLGGLGGVLDLIDSLLFAAPVAWILWVNASG
ncbi:MAG: CDP-archaeol synthase [Planctomycetia bacterium]|jgi:phosphatidate cytidylyltransferase|nr:CDP-archaeol synthase [Planctomycetia bacterium]